MSITGVTNGALLPSGFTTSAYSSTTGGAWGSAIAYSGSATFGAASGVLLTLNLQVAQNAPAGSYIVQLETSGLSNQDGSVSVDHARINGSLTITGACEIDITQGITPIPHGNGLYNFGTQSGTPVTFIIKNVGGANCVIGTIQKGGLNPGDFSVTQALSSTIAPGGSTTFTVTFAPTAAGSRSATISVANNDLNENPYIFSVTGTGQAASNSYLLWTK